MLSNMLTQCGNHLVSVYRKTSCRVDENLCQQTFSFKVSPFKGFSPYSTRNVTFVFVYG